VLRDEGYHRCSVDRISRLAGCSRVSFYQYFSGKEDVFLRLIGAVASEVRASIEALDPLTADAGGWDSLRAWVAREAAIHRRYGPVFDAYGTASAGIEAVAALGRRASEQNIAQIRSRLPAGSAVPLREQKAVVALLLGSMARTFQLGGVLRAAARSAYPRARIEEALTDVLHRTFFGRDDAVNVRPAPKPPPPRVEFPRSTQEILGHTRDAASGPAAATLLAAGLEVFVSKGYAGARIDDIVAAAGVSHGTFYQYFKNKNDLAHVLVMDAMRPLANAFEGMPDAFSSDALRAWLRVYNDSHMHQAALIRVWVDAQSQGATLGADAAPAIDWGRRWVAKFLRPRGFGDVDAEAVVMVALLDAFGSHARSGRAVDAVTLVVQRGLLGL
jgi:AcrR family transcriptional regulator